MADISLPIGPKAVSTRSFEARRTTVNPRQQVKDKAGSQSRQTFRERRKEWVRRKHFRREKPQVPWAFEELRQNGGRDRRVAERRGAIRAEGAFDPVSSYKGRFVDEQV